MQMCNNTGPQLGHEVLEFPSTNILSHLSHPPSQALVTIHSWGTKNLGHKECELFEV